MSFDLRWFVEQSDHRFYFPALAVIAALSTHIIVHRYEPTVIKTLNVGAAVFLSSIVAFTLSNKRSTLASIVLATQCQLIYLITLGLSIIIYRISSFHPLAKYPGPFLARISSFYWASVVRDMTPRLKFAELHKQYGDFVRIGPNSLSVLNVEAINTLYGGKGWPKGPEYIRAGIKNPNPAHASLHLLRSHQLHSQRRRTWDKAFSTSAISSYLPVIYTAASRLVEALDGQASQTIDLHRWTGLYTFDVMRALAFGDSGSMLLDGDDKNGILRELHVSTNETGLGMAVPWLLEFAAYFPFLSKASEFRKFVVSKFKERRTKGPSLYNFKDVFHYLLLEDLDTSVKPSEEQLANDAALVIVAGSDTTHLTLTFSICYLISNKDAYSQLRTELDTTFGGKALDITILEKLSVLNGVINETLRLQPPVASGLTRRAPENGAMLCEFFVPENTAVRVPTYAIHRDPRLFSLAADEFRPSRWFAPERNEIVNKSGFIPFSVGPYSCIGRLVSLHELRIGLAAFMLSFDAKFTPGFDLATVDLGDRFLLNLTSLIPVELKKRSDITFEYPTLI